MSGPHAPLPEPNGNGNGSREHEITINAGTLGAVANLTRIAAQLSVDKLLTLFLAGAFGWLLFSVFQQASVDKVQMARMYEDSRERDKQHCDERDDKQTRERLAESKEVRAWYAQQFEAQRRFESEQREKDRQVIAELTKILARKFPDRTDLPQLILPWGLALAEPCSR